VIKAEGFEVQGNYLEVYRIRHTCELFHPLNKLGDFVPRQWLKNVGKELCVGTSRCVGKKNIVK
jgi:hypothetical protein